MKTKSLLLSALACVAMVFAVSLAVHAQDAAPATATAVSAPVLDPTVTAAASTIIGDLAARFPALITALSLFATLSLLYQALIAFAHKRAAETANVQDDQWLASLEAKPWFHVLDRIFYWGGYLGSFAGGKKL